MSENPEQAPQLSPEERLAQLKPQLEQFRNDVEAIRAGKAEVDAIKTALSEARGSVDADVRAISDAKASFQALKRQAQTHSNQLSEKLEALNAQIQGTEGLKNKLSTVLTEIQEIKNLSEAARNGVNDDVQNINQTKAEFENLRGQAQTLHNDLQGRQTEAQNKIDEIHDFHKKTKELYDELLQDDRDENGNVTEECVNTKIHSFFSEMQNLLQEMKEERDTAKKELVQTREELVTEIRSLLPEAGAAGLSGAYVQAKSKYGIIPYEGTASGFKGFVLSSWHWIKSNATAALYYTMFIAPLIVMIVMLFDLFHDIKSDDIDEKVILFRTMIAVPLAAISFFGWSSIRLSRRLYEEYNHKQRVMQLYHSFKEEVDEHGTQEHKHALLSIMLKAVDDKPSLAMHKYDKGIEDLWPSLSIGSILPFLKGKTDGE
ncbi:MAG: hypothetical protein H6868_03175 [Rhodospirillales bacterium]|nr:hypothetical protein [Rhodospirillales bacterium]